MKWPVIIALLCVLVIPITSAADVTFKDIDSGQPVVEAILFLTNNQVTETEYIDQSGIVTVQDTNEQEILFLIDSLETDGFDYMGAYTNPETTPRVNAFPVGSIVGFAKDQTNNVVDSATLKFQCHEFNLEIGYPQTTDEFGSFVVEAVPLGQCRIFASAEGNVGFTDILIEKGQKYDVEIVLDQKVAEKSLWNNPGFLLLLAIVVGAIIFFIFNKQTKEKPQRETKKQNKTKKKSTKKVKPKKETQSKSKTSDRLEQILPTLNNREKAIVNHLMSVNNEANQASVRHNTSIPRTSLSRAIASLENKNIVEMRKVGKVVKIKLTKWVLGKE
jgi:uncharacterized membrane protein